MTQYSFVDPLSWWRGFAIGILLGSVSMYTVMYTLALWLGVQ